MADLTAYLGIRITVLSKGKTETSLSGIEQLEGKHIYIHSSMRFGEAIKTNYNICKTPNDQNQMRRQRREKNTQNLYRRERNYAVYMKLAHMQGSWKAKASKDIAQNLGTRV